MTKKNDAPKSCAECKLDLSGYTRWEDLPCRTCKIGHAIDVGMSYSTGLFESEMPGISLADINGGKRRTFVASGDFSQLNNPSDILEAEEEYALQFEHPGFTEEEFMNIKEIIEAQVTVSLSTVLFKLLKMAITNPVLFEVVFKKMQFPYMSYSEIGASMNPPCSKQNVLYHLKHAIAALPELAYVIIVDTRYSGGRHAMQTLMDKTRKSFVKSRLMAIMYGNDDRFKARTMQEINKLLHSPCLVKPELFDFKPYVNDDIKMKENEEKRENADKAVEHKRKSGSVQADRGRKGKRPVKRKDKRGGVRAADKGR